MSVGEGIAWPLWRRIPSASACWSLRRVCVAHTAEKIVVDDKDGWALLLEQRWGMPKFVGLLHLECSSYARDQVHMQWMSAKHRRQHQS